MDNKKAIIDYLKGQHSMYSREDFENMLENDPTLMKEYHQEKEIYEMVMTGNIHQKLDELHRMDSSSPKAYKPWLMAAAVILLLGVALLIRQSVRDSTDLYHEYYSPATGLPTYMGSDDHSHDMDDAMVDYKNQKYAKAQKKFEVLYEQNPSDTLAYFIAQSALAQDDNTLAMQYLQEIPQSSSYYEDALWYQVMIDLSDEKYTEARQLLSREKWNTYQRQSEKLLKDLSEL